MMARSALPVLYVDPEKIALQGQAALDEISRADRAAELLNDEIYTLAKSMSVDAQYGINTRYALDFDVIREALEWNGEGFTSQLWSGIAVHLGKTVITLLPGALFEIQRYLADRRASIIEEKGNPFQIFFSETKNSELLALNSSGNSYLHLLSVFRDLDIGERDQYIFRVLQDGLADQERLPPIRDKVFREAVMFLSRGARADRWLNNRADAINYGLTYELNQNIGENGTRYILVSKTRRMEALDRAMCATLGLGRAASLFKTGLVRTPRTAALHQLLMRAGSNAAGAETLAFRILSGIAQYRAQLHHIRYEISSGKRADPPEFSVDGLLVDIIARLDFAQESIAIDPFRVLEMPDVGDIQYNRTDPSIFYEGVEQFVGDRLKKSGYNLSFSEKEIEKTPISLERLPSKASRIQYSLNDEFGRAVGSIVEGEDLVFFTDCSVPVDEFLDAVNITKSSIFSKLSLGELTPAQNTFSDTVYVGVRDRGVSTILIDSHSSYNISRLSELANCLPSDIGFVRIDNDIMSFSFEGDVIACSSRSKLREEFTQFISSVVDASYKGRDLSSPIEEYFRKSKFAFEKK